MKTCTNCGEKKPNKKFVEQCGGQKIVNFMCEECREKSRIKPEEATKLLRKIGTRMFK